MAMKTFAATQKGQRSRSHRPPGGGGGDAAAPALATDRAEIRRILDHVSLHPKLAVSQPDDPAEREADRVAEQVMRMPASQVQNQEEEEEELVQTTTRSAGPRPALLQRQCASCAAGGGTCAACAEEETLSRKPLEAPAGPLVARQAGDDLDEEAEGPLQAKERPGRTLEAAPILTARLQALQEGGQSLPASARAFFEPRFGADFSRVRVHADSRAAQAAQAVQAHAFTVGRDLVFNTGQYAPGTARGRGLLAHELAHVVQQGRGSVIARQAAKVEEEPYIPGEMSRLYWLLPPEERAAVNAEVDRLFYGETGYPRGQKLDPQASTDRPYVRRWLRIRDRVMAGRLGRPAPAPVGPPAPTVTCPCDPKMEVHYDSKTFGFIKSLRPFLASMSRDRGVSAAAMAGAIADEFDTRRGARGVVDDIQDALIDALPEFAIDIDRFFDIHSKLLNTLENDIGPANIKVRTALELVRTGELHVPGSPPSDIQVNRIVDLLLTERGTVAATAAVIAKAQRLFGPHLTQHGAELREAVLMEYFKQGDSYYKRFAVALRANPHHKVCPGDDGCQFLFNRARLLAALGAGTGPSPTAPASPGPTPLPPTPAPGPTPAITFILKSIRFTSDHGMMRANQENWGDSGDYYPEPEWRAANPDTESAPISHTKGQTMHLQVVADVQSASAAGVPFTLIGRGTDSFLSFEMSGSLHGGDNQVFSMVSRGILPNRIDALLNRAIDWRISVSGKTQPLGRTAGHDIFVTYDLPSGGVTHKRMATAVKLTKGFGNTPRQIVSGQMKRFPRYNLDNPVSGNIWVLADEIPAFGGKGADCQSIVRFVMAVNTMIGLPGEARGIAVYASPDAPTTPLTAELVEGGGARGGMWLFGQVGLFDADDNYNNYEAALEFIEGGEALYPDRERAARYYPGGVPGGQALPSKRAVLYVFKQMAEWDDMEVGGTRTRIPVRTIWCYERDKKECET